MTFLNVKPMSLNNAPINTGGSVLDQ